MIPWRSERKRRASNFIGTDALLDAVFNLHEECGCFPPVEQARLRHEARKLSAAGNATGDNLVDLLKASEARARCGLPTVAEQERAEMVECGP